MTNDVKYVRRKLPEGLSSDVSKLWTMIPETHRPVNLLKTFPHIVNRLAFCWDNDAACETYLAGLVFSKDRDFRQGFPHAVASEILALYNYRTRDTSGKPDQHTTIFDYKIGAIEFVPSTPKNHR